MSAATPSSPARHNPELRLARWMLVVLGLAYPAWWLVLQRVAPLASDPLEARLLVTGVALAAAAASYRSDAVARNMPAWLALAATTSAMFSVWLAWANAHSGPFTVHLLATLGAGVLFVRTRQHLVWFWSGVVTAFATALTWRDVVPAHPLLVAATVVALFLLHATSAAREELLQDQIAERTTLLREVFENATDALFLLDPANHWILLVNHRATEIFAAPDLDALLDRDARQLPARPLTEAEMAAIHAAAESGDEVRIEVPCRRFVGAPFWADAAWRSIAIGPRTYLLLRITPIDERIQAQQALEAARDAAEAATVAKSNFLANMSHEIRTPLNGVLGLAQLLERTQLDRDQQAYVSTILASGRTLLSLIDELLDFSRIEAGELVIVEEPFDLLQALDDLRLLFRAQAEAKDLPLRFDVDPSVPARILADGKRIKQVLVNLLGNALKFTHEGEVTFRVERVERSDRPWLRFEVGDTGIGIDPRELPRVFQPFNQADPGIARRYGGTGLGLAISKTIADRVGGRLLASSRPGSGSTFTFELPVRPLLGVVPTEASDPGEGPAPARRRPVLVTEDNAVNRMVIVEMLRRLGCDVDVALDGEAALALLARRSYDVVFMDVMMPGIDGLETTRRLRRMDLPHRPYVVALTAGVLPNDRERCRVAGMDDFVGKPVQLPELQQALLRSDEGDRVQRAAT